MRRGGKAGFELKEMNKTIRSMNFINNSCLFLELGRPAKEGEIRVIFYLARQTSPDNDRNLHTFEEIGELPIDGNLKVHYNNPFFVTCFSFSSLFKRHLK